MSQGPSQAEIEAELDRTLLGIAELQERIWDAVESLHERGRGSLELDCYVSGVMKDINYWMDQCTQASEAPPVLLRRMQIHLARLEKILEMIEAVCRRAG